MEADIDEVSVLQASALQDGGEMAAQVVTTDDVIVSRTAPAADTHINVRQSETTFSSCFLEQAGWGEEGAYFTSLRTASRVR